MSYLSPKTLMDGPDEGVCYFTTIKGEHCEPDRLYTIAKIEGGFYATNGFRHGFIDAIKTSELVCSHFKTWMEVLKVIKYI